MPFTELALEINLQLVANFTTLSNSLHLYFVLQVAVWDLQTFQCRCMKTFGKS